LFPPRSADKKQHHPDGYEWHDTLSRLIARSAPLLDEEWFIEICLQPFLSAERNSLQMLSRIVRSLTIHHVVDAVRIDTHMLRLLDMCAERLINDQAFLRKKRRRSSRQRIGPSRRGALFVAVTDAPQATRFANGDWSQVAAIMPMITRIMAKIGWSSDVMSKFLTLCERAADAYPFGHSHSRLQPHWNPFICRRVVGQEPHCPHVSPLRFSALRISTIRSSKIRPWCYCVSSTR
jgi:hypothetical protein